MDGPVEAGGTGVAVDGRVLGHEVVATFGVVVVLADLTDEDVVAGSDLRRVVEERRTVVALQQVLTEPPWIQSSPPSPNTASAPWPAMMKSLPGPPNVSLSLAPPLVKS